MQNKGSIFIPALIVVVASIIIGLAYINRNSQNSNPTPTNSHVTTTITPETTLIPTNEPTIVPTDISTVTTITGDGFSFDVPNTWKIVRDDIAYGLIPVELYNQGITTIEILTIFTDQSEGKSARDWSIDHYGLGYTQEQEITINGYSTFYSVYKRVSYTDISYVLTNGPRIVGAKFRKLRNYEPDLDNSKFEQSVEEIVNSIQFTD